MKQFDVTELKRAAAGRRSHPAMPCVGFERRA
jgi:hypothetical protein